MKRQWFHLSAILALLNLTVPAATTHYVDLNCTNPVAPYTNWITAATNIQQAATGASGGDTILVTNGVYQYGNAPGARISVFNNVTVQSINGPAVTIIKGAWDTATNGPNALRCAYLSAGAVLSGFTLTNGATTISGENSGGGVYCASSTAIVTNCIIVGNSAWDSGGGAFSGTLVNCLLKNNFADALNVGSGGGAAQSSLINCIITGNHVGYIGAGAINCTLVNCTVVSNSAAAYAGSVGGCTLKNCIVYYNCNYYTNADSSSGYLFTNCCVSFPTNGLQGANNFTNPPMFADLSSGDYHLSAASPCINAGNNSFIANNTDLDGNPRIVGGVVDLGAYEFQSVIHYVKLTSINPISPYTNWFTAATNIQDAVDAATNGDLILVTNGVYAAGGRTVNGYALTNRVVINKEVTVQSVNGAASTIIAGLPGTGGYPSTGIRCVYLTNGAALVGFTMTDGATLAYGTDITNEQSGAAIWCESTDAAISNCILVHSYANELGGGAYQGVLNNCIISNDTAFISGGGTYDANLNNCTVSGNKLIQGFGGGGACLGTLNNCMISGNSAFTGGGACSNTLNNCLLKNNSASTGGGAYYCVLVDCTVVSNSASYSGGGVAGGAVTNSIVFDNNGGNIFNTKNVAYSCTTPLIGDTGDISAPPLFVNESTGDFHLQSGSPCINSGNNASVAGATDLDGNPRIVGGTVDMGAYEFQSPGSVAFYVNLQTITNSPFGIIINWQSVNRVNYFVQRSSDLSVQPAFSTIQSNIVGQPGMTIYADNNAIGQGPYFYRVGVQQ